MGVIDILLFIVFGIVVGFIARFLVPGRDPLGLIGTAILGVVGSFLGGFLSNLVFGSDGNRTAGWIGSVVGAVIALLLYRMVAKPSRA